ncbi:hypothetical protein K8354_03445 [Polaribacter litorisediminis]|uniref:hypothetical protein n=1 Tax=Polaribacter litorisediminis TaxID=1908341 RepID=UPI001CBC39E2|nr:hypothetical protein [Polaribacter litorisediminis]UAM98889.1 hypothetical protein K8354_03445 [Polaribacter litorisediminis]
MKNYNSIIPQLLSLFLLISLLSCNSDDDSFDGGNIPLFTESDMPMIHGNSEKTWRITELINDYYNPSDPLEIEFSCLADDEYTFSSVTNQFSVNLGDDKCFGKNDDGIFTADVEIFDGELVFMDASDGETIYLRYSRGYMNADGTAQGISIRYYTLAELSESRMVFYRGNIKFGEYKEAIVFEAI